MSASDKTIWPNFIVWRYVFVLAMIDALAWGVYWGENPSKLASFLGMEPRNDSSALELLVPRDRRPNVVKTISPPRDATGLWQLLAFISLAHAGFLALAAWRPCSLGQLVIVPLIGHALGVVLWLWALGTTYVLPPERVTFSNRPALAMLTLHDAFWLPFFAIFLILQRRRSGRDSPNPAIAVQ